jgi:hypothetical protein
MTPRTLARAAVLSGLTGFLAGAAMVPAGAGLAHTDPDKTPLSCAAQDSRLPGTSAAPLRSPLGACEHGRKMK